MTADELRESLINEYPALRADKPGDYTARIESIRQLERERRVFSVFYQGADYYPLLQFEKGTTQPKQVIRELIEIFDLVKHDPWELFIWLTCPTGLLDSTKPVEVLEKEPGRVIEAARRERAEPEF